MNAPPTSPFPRNLARPLAAWLRTLGFTALEAEHPTIVTVSAHWVSPDGRRFEADYEWRPGPQTAPKATFHLMMCYPSELNWHILIKGQHVRRLKEVRQVLFNDTRFRDAWQSAKNKAEVDS